jgi:cytochrome bd-type quinol oxidase subunit 2
MRVAERATPVAAVLAALTTLACCLPLSFVGAAGLASVSAWAGPYHGWLLALAAVLLVAGFVQIYRRRNQCRKRSRVSVGLFWASAAIVVLITFFPQVIASLLAG